MVQSSLGAMFPTPAIAPTLGSAWAEALVHHGPLSLTHSPPTPRALQTWLSRAPLPRYQAWPLVSLSIASPLPLLWSQCVEMSLCGGGTFSNSCYLMIEYPTRQRKEEMKQTVL